MIKQLEVIQQLINNLTIIQKKYYLDDHLQFKLKQSPNLSSINFHIINHFHQYLLCTLITHTNPIHQCLTNFQEYYSQFQSFHSYLIPPQQIINSSNPIQSFCIIYLHGYASNRLEGITIISQLPSQLNLCTFDFTGSGKSEGNTCTFGIKEQYDINPIITELKNKGFKKFILWGRSMGAVVALLYTSSSLCSSDVIFQVVDSPFSSFSSICKHQAQNIMKLPSLLINMAIPILKTKFQQYTHNPFNIQLQSVVNSCKVPTLFIYSQHDKIIPPQNTIRIIKNFNKNCYYQKLVIQQAHNTQRSRNLLRVIYTIIMKFIRKQGTKPIKHKKKLNVSIIEQQQKNKIKNTIKKVTPIKLNPNSTTHHNKNSIDFKYINLNNSPTNRTINSLFHNSKLQQPLLLNLNTSKQILQLRPKLSYPLPPNNNPKLKIQQSRANKTIHYSMHHL